MNNHKEELEYLYENKKTLFSKKEDLYGEKKELNNYMLKAFDDKNSAYSKLHYYRMLIDSWHLKSRSMREIYNLDTYKFHRDYAYKDVEDAKIEIGNLKSEKYKLNEEINKIKLDIDMLFKKIREVKLDRARNKGN